MSIESTTPFSAIDDPSSRRQAVLRWGVIAIFSAFLLAKLLLLALLALESAFIMDEYWIVGEGLLTRSDLYQDVWPSKTLLYAYFYRLAHGLADGAVEVMLAARVLTLGLALASLALLYRVARNIGRSAFESLFVVCVALAVSTFMERAFNARPEPLALFFASAALWVATLRGRDMRRYLLAGLLSGAAFLATQKAAYFNLALGLALVGDGLARRSLKAAVLSGACLVAGWAAAVLAYGLFFALQGADLLALYRHVFIGPPVDNVLRGHHSYDGLRGYVNQTAVRNVAPYVLSAFGWILLAPRALALSRPERVAWIFSGVIALLVFAHPAPWPYNFIMAIPFLALWAPVMAARWGQSYAVRPSTFLALILIALAPSLIRNLDYLDNDNRFQNATLERAESLLAPGDSYADGIGMVVTRRHAGAVVDGQAVSWDAPILARIRAQAEAGDYRRFEAIFAGAPKIWIENYRTETLRDILLPFLRRSYVPIFPNLLISGIALKPGEEKIFENRWPGAYRLYSADGRASPSPWVADSRVGRGPLVLGRGARRIRLPTEAAVEVLYLLPAEIAPPFDMRADRRPSALFVDPYGF